MLVLESSPVTSNEAVQPAVEVVILTTEPMADRSFMRVENLAEDISMVESGAILSAWVCSFSVLVRCRIMDMVCLCWRESTKISTSSGLELLWERVMVSFASQNLISFYKDAILTDICDGVLHLNSAK